MRRWSYTPARDLGLRGMDRLRSPARERGLAGAIGRGLFRLAARVYLRSYHRLRVNGAEHLPRAGPVVIAANHQSHLDAVAILAALPRHLSGRVRPVSAADTFFRSVPTAGLVALFIDALALRRTGTGRHELETLRTRLCEDGSGLLVFPEGTRARNGRLGVFRHGLGALVASHPVAVVPCALVGTGRALPPGRRFPAPREIRVVFGPPMTFEEQSNDRSGWTVTAAGVRDAIEALLVDQGVPTENGETGAG